MKRCAVIILLCCYLLAGCSVPDIVTKNNEQNSQMTQQERLLENPILDYQVPVTTPNIMVNQMGYLTNAKKVAIFEGNELPDEFNVYDKDLKKIIFTGAIEKNDRGNADGSIDKKIGYGDFSGRIRSGEYYIEAPIVGQSYSFFIGEDVYHDVFDQACMQYYYSRCSITLTEEYAGEYTRSACHTQKAVLREDNSVTIDAGGGWHQDETGGKIVKDACLAAGILLLSYDIYGQAFTDDIGIPESGNEIPDILDELIYEIEWMLKMQNEATGGVYSAVTVERHGAGEQSEVVYIEAENLESTAAFCALMAKFSYHYQNIDSEFAGLCLNAAERAWRYMEKQRDSLGEIKHIRFWAAAELYRTTGFQTYHSAALEYLRSDTYQDYQIDEAMLGAVTYINTKRNVVVEQCEFIIKYLMKEAEEIVWEARQSPYLTAGNEEQSNQERLLQQMFLLNIVNYIITNFEYETVIQDHIHYFMGRNAKAISYVDNVGVKKYMDVDNNLGMMKQINTNSKFIFILSKVMAKQH